jgi:hypothetical protein
MDTNNERIRQAVEHTEILRSPKQSLSTFGTTNIHYYLVTEPVYSELIDNITETAIREGRVIAQQPRIVTPYYLSQFEGFSTEAKKYFETLHNAYGPNTPGLFYTYRNEPKDLSIVSDQLLSVVDKLNVDIDKRGDPLTSIIKGQDDLWDVSLMKFIFEITRSSVQNNLTQLNTRGLLGVDREGIPVGSRVRIEEFFKQVIRGEMEPSELKNELDRWGLFEDYEDRFLKIFKKRG